MLKERILSYVENKDMENLKNLLECAQDIEILHTFQDLSTEEQLIVVITRERHDGNILTIVNYGGAVC